MRQPKIDLKQKSLLNKLDRLSSSENDLDCIKAIQLGEHFVNTDKYKNNSVFLFCIGLAHFNLGNFAEALNMFMKSYQIEPGDGTRGFIIECKEELQKPAYQ